ncbi:uncharacterized protein LOC143361013 [Halictus rubicundus]|uniref:uncharacterized protein LOC143361013 n=1 Tax=Halictus rubicundus TaxID=77578 RepID=UPI00403616CE
MVEKGYKNESKPKRDLIRRWWNIGPLTSIGYSHVRLILILGVPSPFYGTYRDQNVGERTIESPPKYVALRDLFLPQENDMKHLTTINRQQQYDSSMEISMSSDRSYAGGSYLERQNVTEECDEITSRNPISRRLEYSDFEANGLFHDAGDFCYANEYSACTPSKVKRRDNSGEWFSIIYLPRFREI